MTLTPLSIESYCTSTPEASSSPRAMAVKPVSSGIINDLRPDVAPAVVTVTGTLERLPSFKSWELDAAKTIQIISPRPLSELNEAATRLQKVYKSYRTRRNLADCAVVVEELWWKALDFASLEHSSVSFFSVEKPQTVVSRWARAKIRAAKVGKGLSKDEKARKLALQHWLEAIDPRHRYGHNLHLYYDEWFRSESDEPFFFWLDVGAGREVNLGNCPRSKLQQQVIRYLGPSEREEYEVVIKDGKLIYKQRNVPVHTTEGSKSIFVLSTSRTFYVGQSQKKKGVFQHSSFLAGAATTAAGRLVAEEGVLKAIWPYSGHYLPTAENFEVFISFLEDNHVDLSNVKRCSVDEDPYLSSKNSIGEVSEKLENVVTLAVNAEAAKEAMEIKELSKDVIGDKDIAIPDSVDQVALPEVPPPRLSCKWTSGIGARIGCVRDYPIDLQVKALEHVNLSPRRGPSPTRNRTPIPSPRPSPNLQLSPRLQYMGFPTPAVVTLTLPKNKSS